MKGEEQLIRGTFNDSPNQIKTQHNKGYINARKNGLSHPDLRRQVHRFPIGNEVDRPAFNLKLMTKIM